jgi:hypothetical protein
VTSLYICSYYLAPSYFLLVLDLFPVSFGRSGDLFFVFFLLIALRINNPTLSYRKIKTRPIFASI